MTLPLVSICIPTYNRGYVIEHTLKSVLSQSYNNIEIIISDNNSEDDTLEILRPYSLDPRLVILEAEKTCSPLENWKKCLAHANGDYVKFLWSDDYLAHDFLTECMRLLKPDIGFVYSVTKWYNAKTLSLLPGEGYALPKTGYYPMSDYEENLMLKGARPVSGSCAVFRTKMIRELMSLKIDIAGGEDIARYGAGIDALMFLYAKKTYKKYAYSNETTSFFGVDDGSLTISNGEKLFAPYFACFAWHLKSYSDDDLLIRKFKTRVNFYRSTISRGAEVKKSLSIISDSLDVAPLSTYMIYLMVEHYFVVPVCGFVRKVLAKIGVIVR